MVKTRLDLDDRILGLVLLVLAAGALLGVQLIGRLLLHRYSASRITRVCGTLASFVLILPSISNDLVMLTVTLLALGACLGLLDTGMNAHAADVETRYGRPIMSTYHAVWGVACVAATTVAGAALQAGLSLTQILFPLCVLLGCSCAVAGKWLLPENHQDTKESAVSAGRIPVKVWLIAAVSLIALMCQGAVGDWAGVRLQEVFHVSAGFAALGYNTFAISMTAGRFLGDWIVRKAGSVRLLRYGGIITAVGVVMAITAPTTTAAICGWGLTGIGLSAIPPQLYAASARIGPNGALAVAQVSSAAYFGTLVGPPIIGFVARATSLGVALCILAVFAITVSMAAPVVKNSATLNTLVGSYDQ